MTWQRAYGLSLGGAAALAPLYRAIALSLPLTNKLRPDRWGSVPTPLLGGPAIITAAVAAGALLPGRGGRIPLFCGAITALALGLEDDFRALGPREKFVGIAIAWSVEQASAAALQQFEWRGLWRSTRSLLTCMVGANALNLADNMDGVAASIAAVTAITAISFTTDAVVPASIAGGCLGYLACNSYPAGILMGDAGSLPLGYLVSRLAAEAQPPVCSLLLLAVPALDIGVLLVRRAVGRRSLVRGNTDHLSHTLARIGLPEPLPAMVLLLLHTAACGAALALSSYGNSIPTSGGRSASARCGSVQRMAPLRPLFFTAAVALGVMLGRRVTACRGAA